MSGLVIAGTHSGCGKTTVTLGILAALKKKNYTVQPFKAGPDFIDSGLHRTITGRVSRNLDLWMCGREYVEELFRKHSADSDAAVVEGVMGLYDGKRSTADLAAILGLPVILVVDAYGMAESAAAIVYGFAEYGRGMINHAPTGVIFNRIGSERHYQRIKNSIKDIPVLGYLPRDLDFKIPHRHLGLIVAEEDPIGAEEIDKLADSVLEYIDIEAIMQGSGVRGQGSELNEPVLDNKHGAQKTDLTIGVAYDRAFCFYYEDNFDLLPAEGVTIVKFSPLADSSIPDGLDALYFGGGYPELYAEELSRNRSMLDFVKEWSGSGMPVYAECGGFMYLTEGIYDFDNNFHQLAGVFPFKTVMKKGRVHLGYREVILLQDSIAGPRGTAIRGHEFHYSDITDRAQGSGVRGKDTELMYSVKDSDGNHACSEGYRVNNVLGSYMHIHFGSNPSIANNFVHFIKEHHGTYSTGRAR
jgi:cobyrinic acid a,c-diamide synthase